MTRGEDLSSRSKPAPEARPASPPLPPLTAGRLLLTALGFALWTGLVEEAPIYLARAGKVFVRVSPDLIWMAPLADAMFFGLVAMALLTMGIPWPRVRTRPVVLGAFAALSTLAVGFLQERLYPLAVLLLAIGVGAQTARMARPTPRRRRFLPLSVIAAACLILALTAGSKWTAHAERQRELATIPHAAAGAPNVLLLILDTVRGASLGFLGGQRQASLWPPASSPTLDVLVKGSIVFDDAIAPAPWTLPSHASMFTGRWPNQLTANWGHPLNGDDPTVAEVMARNGYLTVGIVGNLLYASRETGLDRGFLDYEDYPVSLGQTLLSCSMGRRLLASALLRRLVGYEDLPNRLTAADVTNRFLDWQRRHDGRPFFGFVNYYDAHEPYFPPDSLRRRLPPGTRWNDFSYYTGLLTGVHGRLNEKWTMTQLEGSVHAGAYTAAVHRIDLQVGRLLTELANRGVLRNTVLIVASDHGEQLGEHGLFEHQNSLYRTTIHVPLLIHLPGDPVGPRRVEETVSLRDVGATILDIAGLDVPSSGLGGRSLARFWKDDGDGAPSTLAAPDTVFSVLNPRYEGQEWLVAGDGPVMYALSDSAYHYIWNVNGQEELFHVKLDPGERQNLADFPAFKEVMESFRATLAGVLGGPPRVVEAGGG